MTNNAKNPIIIMFISLVGLGIFSSCDKTSNDATSRSTPSVEHRKYTFGELNLGDNLALVNAQKTAVALDDNNNLYIGTTDKGLWIKKASSDKFEQLANLHKSINGDEYMKAKIGDDDNLLVNSIKGFGNTMLASVGRKEKLAVIKNGMVWATYDEEDVADYLVIKGFDNHDFLIADFGYHYPQILDISESSAKEFKELTDAAGAENSILDKFKFVTFQGALLALDGTGNYLRWEKEQIKAHGRATTSGNVPLKIDLAKLSLDQNIVNLKAKRYFSTTTGVGVVLKYEAGVGLWRGNNDYAVATFSFNANSVYVHNDNVLLTSEKGVLLMTNGQSVVLNKEYSQNHKFDATKPQDGFSNEMLTENFSSGALANGVVYLINDSKIFTITIEKVAVPVKE